MKRVLPYNKNLKIFSRELRKNATEAERFFWSKIRGKQLNGYSWYRQRVITDFIVDFYCPKAMLAIELDGGQHYSEQGLVKDRTKEAHLQKLGIKILRFSDREVFEDIDAILQRIYEELS